MMPVYRYGDSAPYQRNQTFSFPQYYNPGFRANSPVPVEPWQHYGGNFGYPMQCHSCSNHSNVPGYNGFRPSYPHASMPSPVNFCGAYPVPAPYHEAYHPVHYVPPPPHYTMEIPKYEYDKNMPRNYHCCGCPNHSCHQNVDKGVKIEEQRPDVIDKMANGSLVPAQIKNYPYPIVWIPPESMSGREQRKVSEPDVVEENKIPSDLKTHDSLKSQEDQRHTWFPLKLNDIGSLMQDGNMEKVRDQHMEDKKKEFPFPIFWMPSYEEGAKKEKSEKASQDQQSEDQKKQLPFPFFWLPLENKQKEEVETSDNREVNATLKVAPMNIAKRGDVTNQARVDEKKPVDQAVVERKEKTDNQKSIPVKQVDRNEENKSEDTERRGRSVYVKHGEDNVANQPSGTSVRRQSASPKKTSELPPVCLRVDPLPRKMKSNGSSRSPSPPGPKALKQETSTGNTSLLLQEKAQQDVESSNCVPRNIKEVEPSKKEKVVEVVDKNISENKDALHTSQIPVSAKEEVSKKPTVGEAKKLGDQCEENMKAVETAKSVADGSKLQRKTLSDVEAAVLIQSAYRGFDVRRWEPLKKLKQIAEIREQVGDVRNRITSLEASYLLKDDKERVIIGETIMRLLLKLDTIQALLPSLRDIRRSLARELVVLQEKLDDLMAKKAQDTTLEKSAVKPMEELGANANSSNCMLEQQKDEAMGLGEGPVDDGTNDSRHHAPEPCEEQVQHAIDSVPDQGELHKESENGDQELLVQSGLTVEDLGSGIGMELTNDMVNGQCNAVDMAPVDTEMGNGSTELEQCGHAPSLVEDKTDQSVAGTSSEVANTNAETREFEELIRGVTINEPTSSETEKDEQVKMSKNEVKQTGEVETKMMPDVTSPNIDVNDKEAEIPEPAELPRDMNDDDGAVNEVKKTEEVEVVKKDDVSQSGEEECQTVFDAASRQAETQIVDQLEEQAERAKEEQPIVPSDERVDVDSRKDEELPGDSVIKVEVELPPQREVIKNYFLPLESLSIQSQPFSLPVQTETHDVVHENGPSDMVDGDDTFSSVLADPETPIEDKVEIERSLEGSEYQLPESKVECEDEKSKLASESLPEKPITTEVSSTNGSVMGVESERKIIEENEKLREMMQKFMEAGNQQLQVISELTGRVKDLEKKLARKKKARTRRCRAAAPPPASSCVKTSK